MNARPVRVFGLFAQQLPRARIHHPHHEAVPLHLHAPADPARLTLCKSKAEFRHLETSIAELEAELGATEDSEIAPDPSENLPRRRRSRGVQKYFRAHNH